MKPTPSLVATRPPEPKHLLFILIASMMLVVLIRDRILLDLEHPVWKHYEPFKWWLLPHGITAALTLLLGPLQFSSRLRRRHLNWHRISSRLYVAGVAIGVPLGIVIETIKYRIGVAPLRLIYRLRRDERRSWASLTQSENINSCPRSGSVRRDVCIAG